MRKLILMVNNNLKTQNSKRGTSRGQASTEMLVTVSTILVFTIPIILLLFALSQYGQEYTAISQAHATVRIISDSINTVYIQGPGAEKSLLVGIPGNADLLKVENGEVSMVLRTSGGTYEASNPLLTNASAGSDFSNKSGLLPVKIKNENGVVVVYG